MIRVTDLESLFGGAVLQQLTEGQLSTVLRQIGSSAYGHWVNVASKDTSHLRFDYLNGIQPVEFDERKAVLRLVGKAAHLLEDGVENQDLREIFLGPNVPIAPRGERGKHQAKDGHFYRAIPFRHTTPGTKANPRGATIGQEMGEAYGDAENLGQTIHKEALQLARMISAPGKGTAFDPRDLARGKAKRLAAGVGGVGKLKPHHTTDIYAGMIKASKKYKRATQSQYITFRTISQAVQNESWFMTIRARKYLKDVQEFVNRIAPRAVEAFIKGITK